MEYIEKTRIVSSRIFLLSQFNFTENSRGSEFEDLSTPVNNIELKNLTLNQIERLELTVIDWAAFINFEGA